MSRLRLSVLSFAACVLALQTIAFSADDIAEQGVVPSKPLIAGPSAVDAGRLAVFRVAGVSGDIKAKWVVYPDAYFADCLEIDGGLTLVFASPKQGSVTLIAAVYYSGNIDVLTHVLENGGADPHPGPDPPAPPPVPPVPPDNPFAPVVLNAKKLTGLDDAGVRDGLEKMADAIESVVKDTKAASLQPSSFRARVREAIGASLGDGVKNWYSFSNEVAKVFEKVNPKTTKDNMEAYAKLVSAMRSMITRGL